MGARYLTDLADVCRAAGLTVWEVGGWQSRARGSGGYDGDRPWVIVLHHTASDTSPANDVNYIVYGCPDAPVANLYLDRDGAVHVCAGGACNHAGKGGPWQTTRGVIPVDQANTHAIGIEAANNGVGQTWPQPQIDAYFTLVNALTAAYGLDVTDVVTHNAWAPTRKIDPATAAAVDGPWQPEPVTSSGTWSLDDIYDELIARANPTPAPPTPPSGDDDMRAGPYLIQATGADGTPAGRVYATDGNMMTVRHLPDTAALEGYRWQATQVFGWSAPELAPGAPVLAVDTIAAFGVIIE
jgi:hypothetical protein